MPQESRRERRFDLEAEKRKRRNFVLMVAAFAALAMVGGVTLALWILSPPDEQAPPPITKKEPDFPEELGFEAYEEPEPEPERRKPTGTLKRQLEKGDVDRGLGKIRSALDKCAATHGAIDGTKVTVDFSVQPNGRVSEAYTRAPHTNNPLGLCVAKVIREKGRFRRTKEGLGDIRRPLTLHRKTL